MATLVTIRNIGRQVEKVGVVSLAIGAEDVFDLDLAPTMFALRSDADLVITAAGDGSAAIDAMYQYAMNVTPRIVFESITGDGTDMQVLMRVRNTSPEDDAALPLTLSANTEHVWEWWIVEGDTMANATVDDMTQLAGDPTGPIETQDALARKVSFGPTLQMQFTKADAGSIRIATSYGGTLTISDPIVFT